MSKETENKNSSLWPEAGDRQAFLNACGQSHSALQWMARLVNSFQVPSSDGSHLDMQWDGSSGTITTPEFAPSTVVELRVPALELQFREGGKLTKHLMALDDKSPAEVEAWSLIELLHRGIDRDKYSKTLPYDVSNLLSGDARHYETVGMEAAFAELTNWLTVAGILLSDVAGQAGCVGALKVRPENFSLYCRIHPGNDRPAAGSFVELGFCAGQATEQMPHFYVSMQPETGVADLSSQATLSIDDIAAKGLSSDELNVFYSLKDRLAALSN